MKFYFSRKVFRLRRKMPMGFMLTDSEAQTWIKILQRYLQDKRNSDRHFVFYVDDDEARQQVQDALEIKEPMK